MTNAEIAAVNASLATAQWTTGMPIAPSCEPRKVQAKRSLVGLVLAALSTLVVR